MQAFEIPDLVADCIHGYQLYLYLPEAKITDRAITSNLEAYFPKDLAFPSNKIVNLVDGETREGWLNFYLLRFSSNDCHLFCFGTNRGTEISETDFAGKVFSNEEENVAINKLKDAVERNKENFRAFYTNQNIEQMKNLVREIVTNFSVK